MKTDLKSPARMACHGPPYSPGNDSFRKLFHNFEETFCCNLHGGTGKYGLASDNILLYSDNLLIIIKNEHLGTGAGTHVRLSRMRDKAPKSWKNEKKSLL